MEKKDKFTEDKKIRHAEYRAERRKRTENYNKLIDPKNKKRTETYYEFMGLDK